MCVRMNIFQYEITWMWILVHTKEPGMYKVSDGYCFSYYSSRTNHPHCMKQRRLIFSKPMGWWGNSEELTDTAARWIAWVSTWPFLMQWWDQPLWDPGQYSKTMNAEASGCVKFQASGPDSGLHPHHSWSILLVSHITKGHSYWDGKTLLPSAWSAGPSVWYFF